MTGEPEVTLCPKRPFTHLSACVLEAEHEGRCIFCKLSGSARGRGAVAVDFFEQGRGTSFRHVMHADCRGRPTRTDAAALYATAQAALKDRQE
jgi:hypothetical protein